MTRVFDCCMAFDEVDMLELRMHILSPVVDHFVIVEAGMTHSGQPKPPVIGNALQTDRFAPFAGKIIYRYQKDLPGGDSWQREHAQRALIGDVLRFHAEPEDWVIVGDADEIANPEAVNILRAPVVPFPAIKFEMDFYYYDFHHRVKQGWAIGACQWGFEQDANKIRTCQFDSASVSELNGGWHCSYFGDAAAIMRKVRSFMHHDWLEHIPLTEAKVQAALDAGADLWGRTLEMERVSLSESLPQYVREHPDKYAALGWLKPESESTWQS